MSPVVPREVRRLAIELPSWVGDCVMATPLLRAAREHCPDALITGFMRPGLASLLAGTPLLDQCLEVDSRGLAGAWRLGAALRRGAVETVVLLPNSFRSALAARLGRVPCRVGYARDGRGWLLTHRLPFDRCRRPTPQVEWYAQLAAFAFEGTPVDRQPALTVTDEERGAAVTLLAGADRGFVLLNPGGNRDDKRWPAERYVAVARHLHTTRALMAVVNGSPGERDLVRSITAALAPHSVDLVERGVTLGSLKAVIERATLVITNDTGPRHIAAALSRPTVALFGPTDHRWTRLDLRCERVLVADPFLPGEVVADDHPARCAVARIAVGDVIHAARSLLDEGGLA